MRIYTKKGDKGETGLPGERRAPKTDQLFETLGCLDQTNALIGVAIALMRQENDSSLVPQLESVQSLLLTVGSTLAAEQKQEKFLQKLPTVVAELEHLIDQWDEQLPPLRNFILVGGTPAGATLHLIRTSVRAAERQFHKLPAAQKPSEIAQALNRLSDFFFQAARYYNFTHHQRESVWKATDLQE